MLELFGIEPAAPERPELSETAARVLARLQAEPVGADALARALELDAAALAAALTELELLDMVSERAGFFRSTTALG